MEEEPKQRNGTVRKGFGFWILPPSENLGVLGFEVGRNFYFDLRWAGWRYGGLRLYANNGRAKYRGSAINPFRIYKVEDEEGDIRYRDRKSLVRQLLGV